MAELLAIDLGAVRDRLAALQLFTSVSDVTDAAEAMEKAARVPAAFVAVGSETATPNRTNGVHDQAVEVTLAVLICMAAERRDERRADVVEALRLPVIATLAGWTPPGATKALDYTAWRIMRISGGHIWGEIAFRTGWRLRLPTVQP